MFRPPLQILWVEYSGYHSGMNRPGGETDLSRLLAALNPVMMSGEYVICCLDGWQWNSLERLEPLAVFREQEALTVVVERQAAEAADLTIDAVFKAITLSPHSSLEAVGLTAAVSAALAEAGIPANIFAAYYHDHIFVPSDRAKDAIRILSGLSG